MLYDGILKQAVELTNKLLQFMPFLVKEIPQTNRMMHI